MTWLVISGNQIQGSRHRAHAVNQNTNCLSIANCQIPVNPTTLHNAMSCINNTITFHGHAILQFPKYYHLHYLFLMILFWATAESFWLWFWHCYCTTSAWHGQTLPCDFLVPYLVYSVSLSRFQKNPGKLLCFIS